MICIVQLLYDILLSHYCSAVVNKIILALLPGIFEVTATEHCKRCIMYLFLNLEVFYT